ncbi:MAG: TadE family protein [Planctomycetota bacterium]
MNSAFQKQPYDRTGGSVVEFALVAPVVILLIFGIVEFSRLLILDASIDQIAYESCRAGIAFGATHDDVQEIVDEFLDSNRIVNATTEITPNVIDDDTQQVRVEITVPLAQNSWGGVLSELFTQEISGACTLEHESELLRRRSN